MLEINPLESTGGFCQMGFGTLDAPKPVLNAILFTATIIFADVHSSFLSQCSTPL